MNVPRPSVLWIATLAVVVGVVVLLREILLPFVAGIAIAYLLDPVVERIERLGVNRTIATLGIVGLFIIGVGGVMVQVTPLLGTEVADFIEKVPQYIGKLQAFANNPGRPWLLQDHRRRTERSRAIIWPAHKRGRRLDPHFSALAVVG